MQIDAGISGVSVVTFSGGAAPPGTEVPRPAAGASAEFLRPVLSRSERLSGPDPSQDAAAG